MKSTGIKVARVAVTAIVLLPLVFGLGGCAKRGKSGGVDGQYGDSSQTGVDDSVRFYGSNLSPEQERELLARNTYHFGLDRYDLVEEDVMSVHAHAKKIVTHRNARVRIEGHTDERGSREYNVALGERRAKAIANLLMLKGVPQEQISVVSYGKEKPATSGHDESTWSQNRRGVIVYEVE
jgi:peptidoglycan-associated lipoprotein